jgi:hypothetical protein
MAEQEMDVVASLFKISRELGVVSKDLRMPEDLAGVVDGASFLVQWIASGLQREFQLAYERGNRVQKELPSGEG